MSINTIGSQGVTLPVNQPGFPFLTGQPVLTSIVNRFTLQPGGDFIFPSGSFVVTPGQYSFLQVFDPIANVWAAFSTSDGGSPNFSFTSDGTNFRMVNPCGFPIGVLVNNGGTGYTSSPTVAMGGGSNAQFLALVGGGVSAINCSFSGANYGQPPGIVCSAPPTPGVPMTATCTVSGGAIATFTIVNPGAGYLTPPVVNFFPVSSDPNFGAIRPAQATAQLSFVGQVTAILVVNDGTVALNTVPTLTIGGGGGSGATATPVMALSVTGLTITTAGSGYTTPVVIMSAGGTITSAAAASNSTALSNTLLIPRQVQIVGAVSGSGVSANNGLPTAPAGIIDGGIFNTPPQLFAMPGPLGQTSAAAVSAVITPTMGGQADTFFVQAL